MRHGFLYRKAGIRLLARLIPIRRCLVVTARLSVMMRQQVWLCLSRLRKLGFQDLGDALMVLLPRTLEE